MAAKGMQKFLHLIGFGEDEEYVEPRGAYTPPRREPAAGNPYRSAPAPARSPSSSRPAARTEARPEFRESREEYASYAPPARSSADGIRMVVLQPQSMEDTQTVIDNLRAGKPVIVNLESLSSEAAQRLLDFISGAIYALGGNIRKVSRGIFLLAPDGVDISGNIASTFAGSLRKADNNTARY